MDKKEDNIRSESYYPDSSYYLDEVNSSEKIRFLADLKKRN